MKAHAIDQRSPEWHALRLGKLTGSKASDMLATLKSGGEAAGRRNLRIALALERITGTSQERSFTTQAMQDGIDREPEAVRLYQAKSGNLVDPMGFIEHDTLGAGYSPDGVVGDFEGLIEVKCPEPAAHLEYLGGHIPANYLAQINHGFWITGALWCDFVSYQPTFPVGGQLKVIRVERGDLTDYIAKATAFLSEVDKQVEAITALVGAA